MNYITHVSQQSIINAAKAINTVDIIAITAAIITIIVITVSIVVIIAMVIFS
jgi:hypothetical protein